MKNWFLQIIVILVFSAVAALVLNAARPGGIAIKGSWPSRTASGEEPIKPPSAQEGDPPFVTLDDAVAKYQSPDIIFIDSRDPEDYKYGHIVKAINIPFDYLDETWEAVIDTLNRDRGYVIYCSGDECESSLFLGRYLYDLGFQYVFVFYGGWQEWRDNNLPVIGENVEREEP